jgi:hypothetical protein
MSQYLLSTYAVEGEVPGAPSTPEEMQAFMRRVVALEDGDGGDRDVRLAQWSARPRTTT